MSLSNDPLAPWNQRDELRSDCTADEGQYRNAGDSQIYGDERVRLVASDKDRSNVAQEEQMHQVHAERQLRKGSEPLRCLLLSDAREEQEGTESGTEHVGCTEFPRPLEHRCLDDLAWYTCHPERPSGKGTAHKEAERTNT